MQPTIPADLGIRALTLEDLSYRQASLTIAIRGTGRRISRFSIDGVVREDAAIPATLTGTHRIDIDLQSGSPALRTSAAPRH
jgi:hypothetical protein